jgi:hypothetical protein
MFFGNNRILVVKFANEVGLKQESRHFTTVEKHCHHIEACGLPEEMLKRWSPE